MTAPTQILSSTARTGQRPAHVLPGLPLAAASAGPIVAGALIGVVGDTTSAHQLGGAMIVLTLLAAPGFFVLQPNASTVPIFFGRYQGTEDRDGLWWTNPLTAIMVLDRISSEQIVELDDERKAAMVSNLMVVLTGDRAPTPVINTGSLYQAGSNRPMAERKRYLLRIDPRLYTVLERWAADDLRSVNAQIEMLLVDQARRAGRWPERADAAQGRRRGLDSGP